MALNLASGDLKDLGVSALYGRYAPTGHIVFSRVPGSLMAAPFNADRLEVTGSPVTILQDVSVSGNGASVFAFSDNGSLAYTTGYVRDSRRELYDLVRISRKGEIDVLSAEPATFISIAPSPDGTRVAASTWDGDLWVYDVVRKTKLRLPRGKIPQMEAPIWSPDGRRLAFSGTDYEQPGFWNLYSQPADGSGAPERLRKKLGEPYATSWSPDGRTLVYYEPAGTPERNDNDVWSLVPDGHHEPTLLLGTTAQELYPKISPDGRWLAYESDESGRSEIYVQSFPSLGEKITISTDGGTRPRWSRNGREIFYWTGSRFDGRIMAVPVVTGTFSVGTPQALFPVQGVRDFETAPDGQGFIAIRKVPDSGIQTQFHLVLNWFDDLRRLAPAPGR